MYQEKIENLKNKIKNIKPEYDYFDREDLMLIEDLPELKSLLIQELLRNIDILPFDYINMFSEEISERIAELEPEKCIESYFNQLLEVELISDYRFEELLENPVSDTFVEYAKQKIDEQFKNPKSVNLKAELSNEMLMKLYNYKRFDILSRITNTSLNLDRKIVEMIKKDWPNNMEYPNFISIYIDYDDPELNRSSFDSILYKLSIAIQRSYTGYNNISFDKNIQKILDLLLQKVRNKDKVVPEKISSYLKDVSYILNNYEYGNEIKTYFFENGVVDLITDLDINENKIKNCIITYLDRINNNENLFLTDKLKNVISNYLYIDEIIEKLIETNQLFFIKVIDKTNFEKYETKIINLIKEKKLNYNNEDHTLHIPSLQTTNINNAINEMTKIDSITIDPFVYEKNEIESLEKILKKNPNIDIVLNNVYNYRVDSPVVKLLIKYQKIESLVKLGDKKFIDILANNYELIPCLKKNYCAVKEFIKHSSLDLIKNSNLLQYLLDDPYIVNLVLNKINHNESLERYYNEEIYKLCRHSLQILYKVDLNKLDLIEKTFGPYILRYIDNENIKKILNLPINQLNRFLKLFPRNEYNMNDLESAYDSLKQHEFSKINLKDVQIFPNILHSIEDKDEESLETNIMRLEQIIDEEVIKNILNSFKIYDKNLISLSKGIFIRHLIDKIKRNENVETNINILHAITDYYIKICREKYRDTYSLESELDLSYHLNPSSKDTAIIKYILSKYNEQIIINTNNTLIEYLENKLKESGYTKSLIEETINYYLYHKLPKYNEKSRVTSSIKIIKKEISELINLHKLKISENKVINILDKDNLIERKYYIKKQTYNPYNMICALNINLIEKNILNDDEIYGSLYNTMKKYKLHMLPEELKSLMSNENINLSGDYSNLAGFISYYNNIYINEKKRLESTGKNTDNIILNLNNILVNSDVYSSVSSVYSIILSNEDANLIRLNPGPNSAISSREERLKKAVSYTEELFKRQNITVPPLSLDVKFNSNFNIEKKMHVVVGNFTNPVNLTHGERTGACMRIDGIGKSLFNFCLTNENGFHIRFEDPETHEYISRVSGFRNGNTVFLNELRNSCNKKKYTDQDVVKSCEIVAKELIEQSKNSTMPIDNVVIHRAYAMDLSERKTVSLGVQSVKEGLPGFYTDVGTSAIVLASSNNEKLVPINFDKTKVPIYKTLREKPKEYKNVTDENSIEIINKINRVTAVKKIMSGINYELIEAINIANGIKYAIISDDWYIYIDNDNKIHSDVVEIDSRASIELNNKLEELEELKLSKNIGDKYVNTSR